MSRNGLKQQQKMQYQFNSPQAFRNSCGFVLNDGSYKTGTGKSFPVQANKPTQLQRQQDLAQKISNLEQGNHLVDSPTRKKFVPGDGSPFLYSQATVANNNVGLGKSFFPPNQRVNGGESPNDQFLRGSCSNVLRKFDSDANLGTSMRNTTRFNVNSKLSGGLNEIRKQGEEEGNFKISQINKNSKSSAFMQKFFKEEDNRIKHANSDGISKTPTKFPCEKKTDISIKGSRTPIKYKNVIDNVNKNSSISNVSKVSTETGDKKVFKSLNQIVANKAKEKMIQQTSKASQKGSKVINGFEIGPVLGKGKFGQVFLGRHQEAGFIVAIKKVVKSKVVEFKMVDQFCQEIKLHSSLQHPNLVRFYGHFQDDNDIYLAMQYMNGGTLFDYLNEVNCLTLKETVEYLRDIIDAIKYMHDKSIAHRDIKPENIVVSSEGVAKLCDFGWSAVVETSRMTYCGTFDYAPPQILERKQYDTSVDIWCIGVLTYELLTGRAPFEGEQRHKIMEKIVNVDKIRLDYSTNIAPEAKQFIEALMQRDPSLRPKSQDLLKFKLFSLFPTKMSNSGMKKPQ